jgi:alkylhydroperoxidase family enzyme
MVPLGQAPIRSLPARPVPVIEALLQRERAALAFTEVVTLLADSHGPEAAHDAAATHFSPAEMAALVGLS